MTPTERVQLAVQYTEHFENCITDPETFPPDLLVGLRQEFKGEFTVSQRAVVGAFLTVCFEDDAKTHQRHGRGSAEALKCSAAAAQIVGASSRSVERAKAIVNRRPELARLILEGQMTVKLASKVMAGRDPGGAVVERVYFIQATSGHIKIGRSTHPNLRLEEFQIGCPFELTLLASFATNDAVKLETMLHRHFAADRFRGEWFHPTERLLSFIKEGLRGQEAG